MWWLWLVLISVSFFVTGILSLTEAKRRVLLRVPYAPASTDVVGLGVFANCVLAFVSAAVATIIVIVTPADRRRRWTEVARSVTVMPWFVSFAFMMFVGNIIFFTGVAMAPNPGLARAVMTVEVVALTVLSWWLYGSPVATKDVIGVVLVCSGIVMLGVQS